MGQTLAHFAEWNKYEQYHESLDCLTTADVSIGNVEEALTRTKEIERKTSQY